VSGRRARLSPLRPALRASLLDDNRDAIAETSHSRPRSPRTLPSNEPVLQGPVESGQYTSIEFGQVLDDHDVVQSVGSVGDALDNALAESFVDTLKTELIADRVWQTRGQLELAIVEYLGWFNDARLHESLGDLPPAEFEALYALQGEISTTTIKI
jgi:transposase InsO family protein